MSPKAAVQASEIKIRQCPHCGRPFRTVINESTICGQKDCWAMEYWGDAEWAGQANMATARINAGAELTDLDRRALHRAGITFGASS